MVSVFLFLTSLSKVISNLCIHVTANDTIPFFSMAEQYSIVYIYYTFFIHSSVSGCFHALAFVNSSTMNTWVHVSFQVRVLSRHMFSGGTAGSYSNSSFNFLRNLHAVFHSSCTNLHSHQQCRRAPFSPHRLQHLFICRLFNDGHSDWCGWCFIVLLICISLIISDVEHLFICLLAISTSSLKKGLFRSSAYILIGLFFLLLLSYISCLSIWEMKPLSFTLFANIFSQSVGFFILLKASFAAQKLISLIRSHLFIFAFISVALGD